MLVSSRCIGAAVASTELKFGVVAQTIEKVVRENIVRSETTHNDNFKASKETAIQLAYSAYYYDCFILYFFQGIAKSRIGVASRASKPSSLGAPLTTIQKPVVVI